MSLSLAVPILLLAGAPASPPKAPPQTVVITPVANRPLTHEQFCRFASQIAHLTRRGVLDASGIRIDSVSPDCAARRVVWAESAAKPLTAPQLATLRNRWNKAMCAGWPFADQVARGWKLIKRVKANGRTYDFAASCAAP